MQTSVTFKNLDPSESLKSYVTKKLNKFDKFIDNPAMASVVLGVEKFRRIAEINVTADKLNIFGKDETDDMYSAIDMVLDKLEKQIKKNKQKSRKHKGASKAIGENEIYEKDILAVNRDEIQIKVKNIEYKPMNVEEAVLLMDITPDNFIVFINSASDRVNVLYKRNDGDYGLIQPV